MYSLSSTRPRGLMLAALAGAVLAAAGCGRAPAAARAPVPASAIGRLTAIAHRAASSNGDPGPGMDHSGDDHASQGAHLGHAR